MNALEQVKNNEVLTAMSDETIGMFTTMVAETEEDKKTLYNAMNSPTGRVKDMINQIIELKDIYYESTEYKDEETGEMKEGRRIVLICADGTSYSTAAIGVFNSLKKIFMVLGSPSTWEHPVKVKIVQLSRGAKSNPIILELV